MAVYILLFCAVIIAAATVVFRYRRQTRKTMNTLDKMLDIAINGEFTEDTFDESMLSAVETKLARYLAASTVSARNLHREKDRIKSLIADIAHQTKTPVANILLYTELLAEQEQTAENRECIAALNGQAKKLQSLIETLVKTSRLETGIIALHPQKNPVDPLLEAATAQIRQKAEAKNIRLAVKSCGDEAVFDAKWTEEALFNLLDNGVKYTPQGGEIAVSAVSYPLFLCIRVADTGTGVSEEEQAKIFHRFYRGAEHNTEEGLGLGLYLARQIAEGQGGYIKVVSDKNAGAVFSLYLPKS